MRFQHRFRYCRPAPPCLIRRLERSPRRRRLTPSLSLRRRRLVRLPRAAGSLRQNSTDVRWTKNRNRCMQIVRVRVRERVDHHVLSPHVCTRIDPEGESYPYPGVRWSAGSQYPPCLQAGNQLTRPRNLLIDLPLHHRLERRVQIHRAVRHCVPRHLGPSQLRPCRLALCRRAASLSGRSIK
jgi:hypothetical protein